MINSLNINITDTCPDIIIEDKTDYLPVKARFKYYIHDYIGSGNPLPSESFTINSIQVNGNEILGSPVAVTTDVSSNLVLPEELYLRLRDVINSFQTTFIASLNKAGSDDYKNWYLDISTFGSIENGNAVTSTSDLTPLIIGGLGSLNIIEGGEDIEARNFSLYSPKGDLIDLGAIAQVDTIDFLNPSYLVGSVFTYSICSSSIDYTVEAGKESRECVIQGIRNKINAVAGDQYFDLVVASSTLSQLIITSKEAGVPFTGELSYTEAPLVDFVIQTTSVPNVSSIDLPSNTSPNKIIYSPKECGGRYMVVGTIKIGCVYTVCEYYFNNWCYDIKKLNECLVSLEIGCCECCKNKNSKLATRLRNKLEAIDIIIKDQYQVDKIQCIIDSAKSICNPLGCGDGCGDC